MRPTQTTMAAAAALAAVALTLNACNRPETEPQASNESRDLQIAKPIERLVDAGKSAKSGAATSTIPASRDDSAIIAKVRAALNTDPTLKAADIRVDARDGTVTLSGAVDTTDMRMHAHQLAATAPGVAGVVDNLSVKGTG